MWEKKTKVQRRRADSSSDDEVLYTDNTRGQIKLQEEKGKRERPPVRNMTLDEDALLDEVDLSESQAHAIIKDLDLTVDDVTPGGHNQQSEEDSNPEHEIDTHQDNNEARNDEIEDNSEDLGGHEIIIDESLSEEDQDEVTKISFSHE